MSERQTIRRAAHDLGLAAWFGGSLFGAYGLNGAVRDIKDPGDRAFVASSGWARWSPVTIAAIATHAAGGLGLILGNQGRLAAQDGAKVNTSVKLGLTVVAVGTTAYSGYLGKKIAEHGRVPAVGGTEPAPSTPPEVAKAQQQLKVLQHAIPVLTGSLIVLGAQQGEQQKPSQLFGGVASGAARRLSFRS